jgi:transcriptional regulator with XRE-family HTH domain
VAGWTPQEGNGIGNVRSGRDKEIDAHVGRRVRLHRTLMGMSQTSLGQAVGITFQQIQKYERGTNRIGASRLYQFSQVLDVPVSFFFDEMPEEVGGRPPTVSDAQVPGGEEDQMSRRETLELVRAYYRISDPRNRKRAREFVKLIADLAAGAEAEGE